MPVRAVRGVVNVANYAARAVVGAPEMVARKLYEKVEGVEASLDDKLHVAEKHREKTITLGPTELESIRYFGADAAIHHLENRVHQAEEEKRTLRIPVGEARHVLAYLKKHGRTDILENYRHAAAILSFALGVLFLDKIRITGMAVHEATGGYDYYSLFGFLFFALSLLLFLMNRRR